MKLLNLQDQYKREIKAEADKIINSTYEKIKTDQSAAFETVIANAQKSVDGMETKIKGCIQKCEDVNDDVKDNITALRKFNCLSDWLFNLSPLLVFVDLAVRLLEHFVWGRI